MPVSGNLQIWELTSGTVNSGDLLVACKYGFEAYHAPFESFARAVEPIYFYGHSNVIQSNPFPTSGNIMTLTTVDGSNMISLLSGGSKLSVMTSGVYNIQFSAQLYKSDAGDDDVEIWLKKNGNNVSDSNTIVTLVGNTGRSVASWNFFEKLNPNEYIELAWYSADTTMELHTTSGGTSPTRPNVPSLILTMNKL